MFKTKSHNINNNGENGPKSNDNKIKNNGEKFKKQQRQTLKYQDKEKNKNFESSTSTTSVPKTIPIRKNYSKNDTMTNGAINKNINKNDVIKHDTAAKAISDSMLPSSVKHSTTAVLDTDRLNICTKNHFSDPKSKLRNFSENSCHSPSYPIDPTEIATTYDVKLTKIGSSGFLCNDRFCYVRQKTGISNKLEICTKCDSAYHQNCIARNFEKAGIWFCGRCISPNGFQIKKNVSETNNNRIFHKAQLAYNNANINVAHGNILTNEDSKANGSCKLVDSSNKSLTTEIPVPSTNTALKNPPTPTSTNRYPKRKLSFLRESDNLKNEKFHAAFDFLMPEIPNKLQNRHISLRLKQRKDVNYDPKKLHNEPDAAKKQPKRRLTDQDILIGTNQEIKKQRLRRTSENVEVISTITIQTTPKSSRQPITSRRYTTSNIPYVARTPHYLKNTLNNVSNNGRQLNPSQDRNPSSGFKIDAGQQTDESN